MRELKSEGLYPKNKGLDDLLMELIFWIKEAHIARRKGYCETGPKDYPLGNIAERKSSAKNIAKS